MASYHVSSSIPHTTEPPEGTYFDSYGQLQLKFSLTNWTTWPFRYKYSFYGVTTSIAGFLVMDNLARRPFYANLTYKIPFFIVATSACYFYGKYVVEKRMLIRDATVNHYMELHPQDFEAIKSSGRKYKEILLPWIPFRAYEKTIPFLSGIKPYFPKEPVYPEEAAAGASQ